MSSPLATLYDRADALCNLAPWGWMQEVQLLAFRHPALPELAYLSVMGAQGDHRSLAVYLGEEALHRFNLIHEAPYQGIDLDADDQLGLILESRQVQVSFISRAQLENHDLDEIKRLGRKYRGKVWPQFRSMRPGRAAGPLDDVEIEVLTAAITQLLDVAPRISAGLVTDSRRTPRFQILGREQGFDGQWRDFWHNFDDTEYMFPRPGCDVKLASEVARLPTSLDLQVAFTLLPTPVGPRFGEQSYPYLLMTVDSKSGRVVGVEVLSIETCTHEALLAAVPNVLLRQLKKAGARPVRIRTTSQRTAALLEGLANELKITIHREREIPELEAALHSLRGMMMRGPM